MDTKVVLPKLFQSVSFLKVRVCLWEIRIRETYTIDRNKKIIILPPLYITCFDKNYDKKLPNKELDAWLTLKRVINGFSGNLRAENAEAS